MKATKNILLLILAVAALTFSLVYCDGGSSGNKKQISDGPVQPSPSPPLKAAQTVGFGSQLDGPFIGPIEVAPGVFAYGQSAAFSSGLVVLNPGILTLEWGDTFPQVNVHYLDNVALGTMQIRTYDADGVLLTTGANDEVYKNSVVITSAPEGASKIEISGADSEVLYVTLADPVELFSFLPAKSYNLPAGLSSLVSLDINVDGYRDVVGLTANEVHVFNGYPGADYLESPSSYVLGSGTTDMVAGDINGDGYGDIAVLVQNSDSIILLENDRNGGFVWPPGNYSTCSSPVAAFTGIINADTRIDVVVACDATGEVWVHKGASSFGFSGITKLTTGIAGTVDVVAGDFNSDHANDLVVVNATGDISLFLSDGLGGFTSPPPIATGASAKQILVKDMNSDLFSDLLVLDDVAGEVLLLAGDGTGAFAAPVPFSTGPVAGGFVVAELNNDGLPDVALPNAPDGASILIGDGKGVLDVPKPLDAGYQPTIIAVDDFNMDGLNDLIFANTTTGQLTLLINQSQ